MKLAIQTNLTADRNLVQEYARRAGLNVSQVSIVQGRENKIAIEFDEQSESRISRKKVAQIAASAGLTVDPANVSVTPRWAVSLATVGAGVR